MLVRKSTWNSENLSGEDIAYLDLGMEMFSIGDERVVWVPYYSIVYYPNGTSKSAYTSSLFIYATKSDTTPTDSIRMDELNTIRFSGFLRRYLTNDSFLSTIFQPANDYDPAIVTLTDKYVKENVPVYIGQYGNDVLTIYPKIVSGGLGAFEFSINNNISAIVPLVYVQALADHIPTARSQMPIAVELESQKKSTELLFLEMEKLYNKYQYLSIKESSTSKRGMFTGLRPEHADEAMPIEPPLKKTTAEKNNILSEDEKIENDLTTNEPEVTVVGSYIQDHELSSTDKELLTDNSNEDILDTIPNDADSKSVDPDSVSTKSNGIIDEVDDPLLKDYLIQGVKMGKDPLKMLSALDDPDADYEQVKIKSDVEKLHNDIDSDTSAMEPLLTLGERKYLVEKYSEYAKLAYTNKQYDLYTKFNDLVNKINTGLDFDGNEIPLYKSVYSLEANQDLISQIEVFTTSPEMNVINENISVASTIESEPDEDPNVLHKDKVLKILERLDRGEMVEEVNKMMESVKRKEPLNAKAIAEKEIEEFAKNVLSGKASELKSAIESAIDEGNSLMDKPSASPLPSNDGMSDSKEPAIENPIDEYSPDSVSESPNGVVVEDIDLDEKAIVYEEDRNERIDSTVEKFVSDLYDKAPNIGTVQHPKLLDLTLKLFTLGHERLHEKYASEPGYTEFKPTKLPALYKEIQRILSDSNEYSFDPTFSDLARLQKIKFSGKAVKAFPILSWLKKKNETLNTGMFAFQDIRLSLLLYFVHQSMYISNSTEELSPQLKANLLLQSMSNPPTKFGNLFLEVLESIECTNKSENINYWNIFRLNNPINIKKPITFTYPQSDKRRDYSPKALLTSIVNEVLSQYFYDYVYKKQTIDEIRDILHWILKFSYQLNLNENEREEIFVYIIKRWKSTLLEHPDFVKKFASALYAYIFPIDKSGKPLFESPKFPDLAETELEKACRDNPLYFVLKLIELEQFHLSRINPDYAYIIQIKLQDLVDLMHTETFKTLEIKPDTESFKKMFGNDKDAFRRYEDYLKSVNRGRL